MPGPSGLSNGAARPRERPRNAMCVQHKWPSANINNRHGKYTVRDDARFFSTLPFAPARGEGAIEGRTGGDFSPGPSGGEGRDGRGRRAAARRGVMEPLSLDNFIIGHWRTHWRKRAQSSGGGRGAGGEKEKKEEEEEGIGDGNDGLARAPRAGRGRNWRRNGRHTFST